MENSIVAKNERKDLRQLNTERSSCWYILYLFWFSAPILMENERSASLTFRSKQTQESGVLLDSNPLRIKRQQKLKLIVQNKWYLLKLWNN